MRGRAPDKCSTRHAVVGRLPDSAAQVESQHDINPRPLTRRRVNAPLGSNQAAAKTVLQVTPLHVMRVSVCHCLHPLDSPETLW